MTDTPHDVLVIGSGAAGLTAALALAETKKVLVLAKGRLDSGSTAWAQGGIAAVLDAGDTFDNHIRDTMVAGAGLNDRETVEFVIERAPASIDRLCELGVPFNREEDDLHLTREGGHSHRRIVHVNDATGWAVQAALLKAAEENPNITLLPGQSCVDLITGRNQVAYSGSGRVWGAYALDEGSGKVVAHVARATVMAAGGAGRVYLFSTAPRGATGDGIAMAWRAGARVSNMEMMQFHPTCLYNLEVKNFLITEAVRGEGGRLVNPDTGERYMEKYDPERMELAPRDIAPVAVPPAGKIAGAVADDGVGRQRIAHELHGLAQVEPVAIGMRGGPFLPLAMRFGPGVEIDDRAIIPQRGAFGEFVHAGANREVGGIDAVEFVRIGMDMDQLPVGRGRGRDGIAIGRRLAQPRADRQDQVGLFDALDQLGIGAIAQIAGINLT